MGGIRDKKGGHSSHPLLKVAGGAILAGVTLHRISSKGPVCFPELLIANYRVPSRGDAS